MNAAAIDPASPFQSLPALIAAHAAAAPDRPVVTVGDLQVSYGELDRLMDRVAARLRLGRGGATIAICATTSVDYLAVFLGALRAGVAVAPMAPSLTDRDLAAMLEDAEPMFVFGDADTITRFGSLAGHRRLIRFDPHDRTPADHGLPGVGLHAWLEQGDGSFKPVAIEPGQPFNIIYSSGTTGTPKGIVQSHAMRWSHIQRAARFNYGPDTRTLLSTPLYSNTTLVVLIPTLAYGGGLILMPKFSAFDYLRLAERERVTHTMLVPVQYQRLLALAEFDRFDLSSYQCKFCTSAPFSAALKADVLRRWPGRLVEFYGMTEGGGSCILDADQFPSKLHTVGRPVPGHDIRLIDEQGVELGPGATGEVVGHSPAMMIGYHRQSAKTREVEWFDSTGKRFIRTGDIGRFDKDGFLTLLDRKKDVIISGGFNVYPSDIEAVMLGHPDVAEVAVVGVDSPQWGETPVAFVVRRAGADIGAQPLLAWTNERVGKVQRINAVEFVAQLPRSAIGKVLKRQLREHHRR